MEQSKIALITGGTQGLGASFALECAKQGYHVIVLARHKKTLTEIDDQVKKLGGQATLIPFDLKNVNLIDSLIVSIAQRFQKLDLLMLNAAILGQLRPIGHTPNELWEDTMNINLKANFLLLRGLDPLLRRSRSGQVIFVSDPIFRNPSAFWGSYAISKAGFDTLAKIYAEEIESITSIRVHKFEPNPMATSLRAKAFPGEKKDLLSTPIQEAQRLSLQIFKTIQLPRIEDQKNKKENHNAQKVTLQKKAA